MEAGIADFPSHSRLIFEFRASTRLVQEGTGKVGRRLGTTKANPTKPNRVKGFGISKIGLAAEKQTHSVYLVLYQYDGEKK